jgi:hypothetical protein
MSFRKGNGGFSLEKVKKMGIASTISEDTLWRGEGGPSIEASKCVARHTLMFPQLLKGEVFLG